MFKLNIAGDLRHTKVLLLLHFQKLVRCFILQSIAFYITMKSSRGLFQLVWHTWG